MRFAIALLLSTITGTTAYNSLFIGHSFFCPIGRTMEELVADAGVSHRHQEVFSGGASGTPSALWNNAKKRKEAQKILDGGDIDLFGMPVDAMDGGGKMTTEFYEKWINYARTKNPDTIVMIGLPWLSYPSDFDTATYTSKMRSSAATFWPSVLDSLRAKYPGVTIIDNPYGLGIVESRPVSCLKPEVFQMSTSCTAAVMRM